MRIPVEEADSKGALRGSRNVTQRAEHAERTEYAEHAEHAEHAGERRGT